MVHRAADDTGVVRFLIAGGDGVLDVGLVQADVVIDDLHLRPQTAVLLVGAALLLVKMDRAGCQNGAAGLDPRTLNVQKCGARSGDVDDVSLTHGRLEILLDDGFDAKLLAHVGGQLFGRGDGVIVADDLLDVGHLGDDVVEAGRADRAAADAQQHLRVLACEVARGDAGHGTGARGTEKVRAHVGKRFAGVLVVQRDHQHGARQTLALVGGIGAVPLLAADVKAAAEVSGHGNEAAVGSGDGHIRERALLGENDIHTVIVVVIAAHEIVALGEKGENLFCVIDALGHIQNAGRDGIGFGQVKEFGLVCHVCSPFSKSRGCPGPFDMQYIDAVYQNYRAARYVSIFPDGTDKIVAKKDNIFLFLKICKCH